MATTEKQGKAGKKPSGMFSGLKFGGDDEAPRESRFEITLEEMHKKFSPTVISRLQILNLASLIVRRDVDQDEVMKKAELIAMGVIEDNFGEKDAYVHNDIGVYGFLFPGMSKQSAQLKRQVIADQIARLINDADSPGLSLEFEAKAKKRRGGRFADVVGSRKKAGKKTGGKPDPAQLRELEKQKALANLAVQQMTMRSREAEGSLIETATWWDGETGPRAGAKGLPENLATMFRAMWNVSSKLLTAYAAQPVLKAPDGRVESIVRLGGDSEMYAALAACDRLVQEEALNKLHLLVDAGHKVVLVLPVHYSTVDRYDYFVPYQQRLRRLKDRQRQLVVQELVGTPQDAKGDRIRETVTRLRQAARSVMVRLPASASGLRVWRDAGAHAVGFEFADGQSSERGLISSLNRFAERADEAGLKKFVYGLTTRSAASAAVAAGYDYVEGDIVRPPADSPTYVEPFESLDLFAGMFRR